MEKVSRPCCGLRPCIALAVLSGLVASACGSGSSSESPPPSPAPEPAVEDTRADPLEASLDAIPIAATEVVFAPSYLENEEVAASALSALCGVGFDPLTLLLFGLMSPLRPPGPPPERFDPQTIESLEQLRRTRPALECGHRLRAHLRSSLRVRAVFPDLEATDGSDHVVFLYPLDELPSELLAHDRRFADVPGRCGMPDTDAPCAAGAPAFLRRGDWVAYGTVRTLEAYAAGSVVGEHGPTEAAYRALLAVRPAELPGGRVSFRSADFPRIYCHDGSEPLLLCGDRERREEFELMIGAAVWFEQTELTGEGQGTLRRRVRAAFDNAEIAARQEGEMRRALQAWRASRTEEMVELAATERFRVTRGGRRMADVYGDERTWRLALWRLMQASQVTREGSVVTVGGAIELTPTERPAMTTSWETPDERLARLAAAEAGLAPILGHLRAGEEIPLAEFQAVHVATEPPPAGAIRSIRF